MHVFVLALLYIFECLNEWRQHSDRLQLLETSVGNVIRFRKRRIMNYWPYNVIYDKKFLTRIRICMWGLRSSNTLLVQLQCHWEIAVLRCFPNESHFSEHEGSKHLYLANWHILHFCRTSWTSPKYTDYIHVMFVAGIVPKRKGFSSVLILSNPFQNKSTSDPSPRPPAACSNPL